MRLLLILMSSILLLAGTSVAHAQGPYGDPYGDPYGGPQMGMTGNVVLFLGTKTMDSADWAPLDEHTEVGLVLDVQPSGSPVGIDLRLLSSESDTTVLGDTMTTSELDIGARMTWGQGGYSIVRPYVAGGLAMINAELFGVSDSGTGIWLAGGVYWILSGVSGGPGLTLGMDLMSSAANADFGTGIDAAIGGGHINFTVGYHF
jgi:hypothetical protein